MTFVVEQDDAVLPLDQFSTSPTLFQGLCCPKPALRCDFGAPFFAYSQGGMSYAVVQGNCNHWECKRCGVFVAKAHYGRIVEGARTLAKEHDLWFITITCRGADLSEAEATKNYLSWTSRFLDACYTKAHRVTKKHPAADAWHYVQVTEKQKRGHPHSHILTTFSPDDLTSGEKSNWRRANDGSMVHEFIPALRSKWLQAQVIRSGLGDQYDISKVQTVEGASRYVAKYMFKAAQFEAHYPKRWKRVRYGDWPKLERKKGDAFVLLSRDDWYHLASLAVVVDAERGDAFDAAKFFLRHHDVLVFERKEQNVTNDRK